MKKEIEIKRLKEIDFLSLISIKEFHWDNGNGQFTLYYEIKKLWENRYYYGDYKKIIKYLKFIYKDLEKYKKRLNKHIKDFYIMYGIKQEAYDETLLRIEKYLEYKRLENKYALKNTTEKRSKI